MSRNRPLAIPPLLCQVDGKRIPLTLGFIVYATCGHTVCERCAGRDWTRKPEPKRCPSCRGRA